jgi:hypothetical protein
MKSAGKRECTVVFDMFALSVGSERSLVACKCGGILPCLPIHLKQSFAGPQLSPLYPMITMEKNLAA